MSIGGPQALASLEEALRDVRREEDEIAKRSARAVERLSKIRETEVELFRKLARVRLDPGVQSELDGRLLASEAKARTLLKSHAQTLAKTEKQLTDIDGEIARLTTVRTTVLGELTERRAALDALATQTGVAMGSNLHYSEQRQRAEELAAIAAQSVEKTEQAERDREEKGRPYRDDPLFMYLWTNGYGTSAYRGGNVTRLLDGWVARLIGFAKARPNYAMLDEIPLRLREHADRGLAATEAAEAELDRLEAAAIDAAGGQPIREAIAALEARIATIDADLVAAEDRRDDLNEAVGALSQGSDPAFADALNELAEGLEREDLQTLLAEARRTATAQDDTIIAQIDDARARSQDENAELAEQKARLKTLAGRRRELEDIQFEFKKARFDDPRSSFREDKLVGDMLNDFLRGGITAASYWDSWRKSQNWNTGGSDWGSNASRPETGRQRSNSPGGGFQWPDASIGGSSNAPRARPGSFGGGWGGRVGGGSSSPGGGFSRPRTGSSGTRKSGGFKTGGGF